MNSYISNKIRTIQFVSMLMIVLLHANMASIAVGWEKSMMLFITQEIARIAVPIFFMCSGFLFFYKFDGSLAFFTRSINRRVRSLVVPFVLWNVLVLAFLTLLVQFTDLEISAISLSWNPLDMIFHPVIYSMWFIRELFILVILSPLIYALLKNAWWIALPLVFVPLALGKGFLLGDFYFSCESIAFFTFGSALSLLCKDVFENYRASSVCVFGFLTVWLLLSMALHFFGLSYWVHIISILCGMSVLWLGYDVIYTHIQPFTENKSLLTLSMWVFCFHEPMLTMIKKAGIAVTHSIVITYFLAPIICIGICIAFGFILRKYISKIYSILVGGR